MLDDELEKAVNELHKTLAMRLSDIQLLNEIRNLNLGDYPPTKSPQ